MFLGSLEEISWTGLSTKVLRQWFTQTLHPPMDQKPNRGMVNPPRLLCSVISFQTILFCGHSKGWWTRLRGRSATKKLLALLLSATSTVDWIELLEWRLFSTNSIFLLIWCNRGIWSLFFASTVVRIYGHWTDAETWLHRIWTAAKSPNPPRFRTARQKSCLQTVLSFLAKENLFFTTFTAEWRWARSHGQLDCEKKITAFAGDLGYTDIYLALVWCGLPTRLPRISGIWDWVP